MKTILYYTIHIYIWYHDIYILFIQFLFIMVKWFPKYNNKTLIAHIKNILFFDLRMFIIIIIIYNLKANDKIIIY